MGRKALEGAPLLHTGKARIEYHRVIAGGRSSTPIPNPSNHSVATPAASSTRSAVSRSPSSVNTAGFSAPASRETQRTGARRSHPVVLHAPAAPVPARGSPPHNPVPARRALRQSSARCRNARDGIHGYRRSHRCDASADQRSQCFKSSTEWRFSAEPRVSMGLGVPDRKGCASSNVISKLGASVASAIAKERPARPPPRIRPAARRS